MTKYNDIMAVDTNHGVFSSAAALGGITIRDVPPDLRRESFIAMDQPRHGAQRKTVAPMFTPTHLDELAINIRKRSAECRGWSIEMKLSRRRSGSMSRMVMPPREEADENTP